MKRNVVTLVSLFAALAVAPAPAQQNLGGKIQHVIIVIQENRTPDNLFHEDTLIVNHGADVIPSSVTLQTDCTTGPVAQVSAPLASCFSVQVMV